MFGFGKNKIVETVLTADIACQQLEVIRPFVQKIADHITTGKMEYERDGSLDVLFVDSPSIRVYRYSFDEVIRLYLLYEKISINLIENHLLFSAFLNFMGEKSKTDKEERKSRMDEAIRAVEEYLR